MPQDRRFQIDPKKLQKPSSRWDEDVRTATSKAETIGPSSDQSILESLLRTVSPTLAGKAYGVRQEVGKSLPAQLYKMGTDFLGSPSDIGNISPAGIIPAARIRDVVNKSKAIRPLEIKTALEWFPNTFSRAKEPGIMDEITKEYQGLVNRLYQSHPRVMSTVGKLGISHDPTHGGLFKPGPFTAKQLLELNHQNSAGRIPVGDLDVGYLNLISASPKSQGSLRKAGYHEAAHGAQGSFRKSLSAYRQHDIHGGYALNPYEIGAEATAKRERIRDFTSKSGPARSYVNDWINEVNSRLGKVNWNLLYKQPTKKQLNYFESTILPEQTRKFGLDKRGERLVMQNGEVARELYQPGTNRFNTFTPPPDAYDKLASESFLDNTRSSVAASIRGFNGRTNQPSYRPGKPPSGMAPVSRKADEIVPSNLVGKKLNNDWVYLDSEKTQILDSGKALGLNSQDHPSLTSLRDKIEAITGNDPLSGKPSHEWYKEYKRTGKLPPLYTLDMLKKSKAEIQ